MQLTVILTPGAFVTDAEFWYRPLAELLEPQGIAVRPVNLPSCGTTPPLGDLYDDAAKIRNVIDEVDGPVILGGHSYSGNVITEAAAGRAAKVRHLLYFSAVVGDSCVMESDFVVAGEAPVTKIDVRLLGRRVPLPKPILAARAGGQGPWSRFCYAAGRLAMGLPGVDGSITEGVGEDAFKSNELRRLSDKALIPGALERVTSQSLASFLQSPKHLAWKEIPSTYFLGLDDCEVPRPQLWMQARRCTKVVEIPATHFCHIDRPDVVAGVVADIADEIRVAPRSQDPRSQGAAVNVG